MAFFDSILESLWARNLSGEPSFVAVLYGDNSAYIEKVCSVKSYSACEIVLAVKRGELIISGENMYIKKYCQGDVCICGKIQSIVRV